MIDIDDMRKRHANSIRNTATGRALGLALEELEKMRALAAFMERSIAPEIVPHLLSMRITSIEMVASDVWGEPPLIVLTLEHVEEGEKR